jgi:hypothetical protein
MIPLRSAWQGCYGSAQKISPLPFLLANAHVASCGWLGIHEAHLQAFGFWGEASNNELIRPARLLPLRVSHGQDENHEVLKIR